MLHVQHILCRRQLGLALQLEPVPYRKGPVAAQQCARTHVRQSYLAIAIYTRAADAVHGGLHLLNKLHNASNDAHSTIVELHCRVLKESIVAIVMQ
jgi:hypothetical protein